MSLSRKTRNEIKHSAGSNTFGGTMSLAEIAKFSNMNSNEKPLNVSY